MNNNNNNNKTDPEGYPERLARDPKGDPALCVSGALRDPESSIDPKANSAHESNRRRVRVKRRVKPKSKENKDEIQQVVASNKQVKASYQNIHKNNHDIQEPQKVFRGLSNAVKMPINADFVPSENVSGIFMFYNDKDIDPSLKIDIFLNGRIVGRTDMVYCKPMILQSIPQQLLRLKNSLQCSVAQLTFKQMFGSHVTKHNLPLYHLHGSDVYICVSDLDNQAKIKIYYL